MTTAREENGRERVDLKPCPFCGEPPVSFRSGIGNEGLMIECVTVGCVGPHISYIPPQSAIEAWNRRAS